MNVEFEMNIIVENSPNVNKFGFKKYFCGPR